MLFLKKLVTDRESEEQSQLKNDKRPEIEMVKMPKPRQDK
jgi:hypothetical protein